jgi:adenine-specific DNA-methyltransferase
LLARAPYPRRERGTKEGIRYDAARRRNNPPAGLAGQAQIREQPRQRYSYDPHLPPVLRFDDSGFSDRYPELLESARQRTLTADEVALLAEGLRVREPWLEWTGNREQRAF